MILKRFLLLAAASLSMLDAAAQIPYYAATVGDSRLYCYSSVKARPGVNAQETYTTFQYGIGDHFATGLDLYTGKDCAYWGALLRYGLCASKWVNVGAEVTPSFNLNDSFHFSYLTSALYLNGPSTRRATCSGVPTHGGASTSRRPIHYPTTNTWGTRST